MQQHHNVQPASFASSLLSSPQQQTFAFPQEDDENDEMFTVTPEGHEAVRVFPRRKAGEPRRPRKQKIEAVVLTKQILSNYFNIPLPEVAELLVRFCPLAHDESMGIGSTSLKSSCRKLGISRWPFPPMGGSGDVQAGSHHNTATPELQPETPRAHAPSVQQQPCARTEHATGSELPN
eukprot:751569-Rhodomonas_salina.1